MKIAIFSRSGPCFPNIISQGLMEMLKGLGIEAEIFYESIPMLMRLLPLTKKPRRWHNNLIFRIRNKLSNLIKDRELLRRIKTYDAVVISECYPNAFWKNYFAVEELKKAVKGKLVSYTEGPLNSAPGNKAHLLKKDDYDESIYDYNLFVTDIIETRILPKENQAIIGVNISNVSVLQPSEKKEFCAVVDFAQSGYEFYREQQIEILTKLGIKTIRLEGRYPIEEIRKIYKEASIFFISFPETFGLPISECLACGVYIFSPESSWPMSWRLDPMPQPMGPGTLPDCFQIYNDKEDLEKKLSELRNSYDLKETPKKVYDTYIKNYRRFFQGDSVELRRVFDKINNFK